VAPNMERIEEDAEEEDRLTQLLERGGMLV
jgi:hypothetical protein